MEDLEKIAIIEKTAVLEMRLAADLAWAAKLNRVRSKLLALPAREDSERRDNMLRANAYLVERTRMRIADEQRQLAQLREVPTQADSLSP